MMMMIMTMIMFILGTRGRRSAKLYRSPNETESVKRILQRKLTWTLNAPVCVFMHHPLTFIANTHVCTSKDWSSKTKI
jgi:hypothetical protein